MPVFKSRKPPYPIQPPLTSLIDIVFLLLIYFLLTTNFITEEGIQIRLPEAKSSAPQVTKEITVYVDQQGDAFIDNESLAISELFTRLQEMIGTDPDRLVIIKADKEAVLNEVVTVMDIAKAAGASRLTLATEKGL
jgi:biopolymer transport protein ExbD